MIDQVREKMLEDRRLTVQKIVAEVGISSGSVHSIRTEDLNLRRVSAKFVPKLLTEQHKELRKEISEDMLVKIIKLLCLPVVFRNAISIVLVLIRMTVKLEQQLNLFIIDVL